MEKTFTLTNGKTVTFETVRAKFLNIGEGILDAIKMHDEDDVFCDGDCITEAETKEMPTTVEEAEQFIEDNYWSTIYTKVNRKKGDTVYVCN